ncbi:MAG: YgeY family selenium metabolism-linked hydrolase, partial [Candidatus Thermoplasmatota archaeon]
ASDNKGGMASMVYGAKIINKARIEFDGTLYIAGVVQEEDCEGFAISKIIDKIKPDYVLLGECTSLNVNIGHRGRAEIKVVTKGKACHASTPNRGENAIYNMLPIIEKIKKIRFKRHKFLGRGTIAVTKIESSSPSLNAIPDECKIYLDRRLTFGETKESCIKELKEIADKARVEVLRYNSTSYKGKLADLEKYFPTWLMEQKHEFVQKAVETGRLILGKKPKIGKWDFSTDGIYTMGIARIPTIGFGPGEEKYAHTNEDNVMINELVNASAFYALFPNILLGGDKK